MVLLIIYYLFTIESPISDRRSPTPNKGSSNLTASRQNLKGKTKSKSTVRRISLPEDEVDSDYAYNEYTTGISKGIQYRKLFIIEFIVIFYVINLIIRNCYRIYRSRRSRL